MDDLERIGRVADERNLTLADARELVGAGEQAANTNERRACWNCGDPQAVRCCEYGRDRA